MSARSNPARSGVEFIRGSKQRGLDGRRQAILIRRGTQSSESPPRRPAAWKRWTRSTSSCRHGDDLLLRRARAVVRAAPRAGVERRGSGEEARARLGTRLELLQVIVLKVRELLETGEEDLTASTTSCSEHLTKPRRRPRWSVTTSRSGGVPTSSGSF